jgi:hypothetical protein
MGGIDRDHSGTRLILTSWEERGESEGEQRERIFREHMIREHSKR